MRLVGPDQLTNRQNTWSQTKTLQGPEGPGTHGGHEAVVQGLICKENGVFDEDGARSQDEGEEQVDVNVVPGAAKLPAEDTRDAKTPGRKTASSEILWAEPVEAPPIGLCFRKDLT